MVSRHKQVILFITLIAISLTLASCRGTGAGSQKNKKRNIPIELKSGDIAFRRGSGIASEMVLAANSRGSFSHVGVVVKHGDRWHVIHEVPYEGKRRSDDKIYSQPIEEFFGYELAVTGAILRIDIDSAQLSHVLNYLELQLARGTLFDHRYNLDDDSELYCSELVWRAYMSAEIDLTEGRRTKVNFPGFSGIHIFPSDIAENSSLLPIYSF